MIRIGLIGCRGRMGQAFTDYTSRVDDFKIEVAIDIGDLLEVLLSCRLDVVLDLSLGSAVAENGPLVVSAGFPYIVGASGVTRNTTDLLDEKAAQSNSPVLIVPNFSVGATLMMNFARKAAMYMQSPVITERHHDKKLDAPSGTAIYTADLINSVAGDTGQLPDCEQSLPGVMGGAADRVAIHSVRGAGYLAEQSVQFSLPGETLEIEHRSIDRGGFMAGIDIAIRNIGKVNGLQVGLETVMDL